MTYRSTYAGGPVIATATNPISALFGGPDKTKLLTVMLDAGPACDLADAELFTGPDLDDFDEPDQVRQEREAKAKAICGLCPAWAECLAYALAIRPTAGVWAGLTADELRGIDARMELAS